MMRPLHVVGLRALHRKRRTGGLVGIWLSDGTDPASAPDHSGNLNHGTITGAIWAAGKNGRALSFDGVDDLVNAGNNASLNIINAITIEAWMKIVGSCGGDCDIFVRGTDGVAGYRFTTGTALRFDTFSPTKVISTSENIISNNIWYHIAVTKSGTGVGSVKLYLNGVNVTFSYGNHGNPVSNNNNAYIGTYIPGEHEFNGSIDEVRIWNRALSAEEIKDEYNNRRRRYGV